MEMSLNNFHKISDSSNSGGENMYTLMKPAGGNMGGVSKNIKY